MNDIQLPARVLFELGPFPITDGFLGSLLVTITLLTLGVLAANRFSLVPTRIQVAFEFIVEYLLEQLENAFGSKEQARSFLPLFATTFIFITIANQFMLVPFIFNIMYDGAPLFRQSTSDFAQPIALSLLMMFLAHVLAFRISPLRHLSNFFPLHLFVQSRSIKDFANALLQLFIGVLNIIGELGKTVSLAARLFGNIFAGNVMVAVIIGLASFTQFLIPIPFIALSIFSGFIQAFVFTLLSIQFIAISMEGAKPKDEQSTKEMDVVVTA